MSDLVLQDPGVDPKLGDAVGKYAGTALPSALASWLTWLSPDVNAAPGSPANLPGTGLVQRSGGLLGTLYDIGRTTIPPMMDKLGVTPHLTSLGVPDIHNAPPATTLNAMGAAANKTEQAIFDFLPHAELTPEEAPDYQSARVLGSAMGSAIPIPGLGQLTSLSKVTKPLEFLLPTSKGATVGVPLAGALAGGALALAPGQAEAAPTTSVMSGFQLPTEQQTMGTQPAQTSGVMSGFSLPQDPGAAPFSGQGESGVSNWQVLAGVGAAIGIGLAAKYAHGLSSATTAALRDARMVEPAFAKQVADFADARIKVLAGELGPGPGNRAAAPTPQISKLQEMATKAKAGLLDEDELLKNYIYLTSDTPTMAKKLGHQVEDTFDEMAWQNKLRQFLVTGKDAKSGLQLPSLDEYHAKLTELTPAQVKTYREGLHAANALDDRRWNALKGITPTEHDFSYASDQDLARYVVAMQRDPVLRELQQTAKTVNDRIISIGEARGFFSAKEARDIRTAHPNYVPEVDKNGNILHAMAQRDRSLYSGIDEINSEPWVAQAQHVETLLRQYELNDLRGALMNHFLNVQDNVKGAPQVIERLPGYGRNQQPTLYPTVGQQSAGPREMVIGIRRPGGMDYYKFNDPTYFNMFKTDNATRMHTTAQAMETMRTLSQAGTTGVMATATGRVFPLVNMARTMLQGPINAPKGYSTGLIDTALQRTTGLNFRLPDPTTLVGVPYSMARGGVDDLALQLSRLMDSSNPSYVTQLLNSTLTPATVDRMGQRLKDYYLSTATHEMRAGGLGGQGTPIRARPPSIRMGDNTVRLVSGQLNPTLFMPPGKWGTIKGHTLRLQAAADEIFSELSDATHQYYYRVNRARGMSALENTAITRNLVGNPSTVGSSAFAKATRAYVPYANISMQGMSRLGQSFKERPLGTTAGVVGSLGSLAMLSLYTAMQSPEALDYLENVVNLQGLAANVHLFTNPDPNIHAEFSLPQEFRAPFAMILGMLADAFHTTATRTSESVHDGVYGFLKDWFSHHVQNQIGEATLHGAADALNIAELPPLGKAIGAMGGNNIQLDLERVIQDYRNNNLGWHSIMIPVGADRPLPNQPSGDTIFDNEDSKRNKAVVSSILGAVGGLWDQLEGYTNYHKQTGDFLSSIGQVGKDWLQAAKDNNKMLNTILWEDPVRASFRSPVIENTQRELDKMKYTEGARTAERFEGYTGSANQRLPVTTLPDQSKVPKDPMMADLFQRTAAEYAWINKIYMPQINAMRTQMANEAKQMVDNTERRVWENEQKRKISDIYQQIQVRIDDLNAQLSAVVGKPVLQKDINWKQGREQFR